MCIKKILHLQILENEKLEKVLVKRSVEYVIITTLNARMRGVCNFFPFDHRVCDIYDSMGHIHHCKYNFINCNYDGNCYTFRIN